MGGRDHSEQCGACGVWHGGLNDTPCDCAAARQEWAANHTRNSNAIRTLLAHSTEDTTPTPAAIDEETDWSKMSGHDRENALAAEISRLKAKVAALTTANVALTDGNAEWRSHAETVERETFERIADWLDEQGRTRAIFRNCQMVAEDIRAGKWRSP